MGLDTAYIPVRKQDIEFFIGDIVKEPNLLDKRLQLLTQSKQDREFLRKNAYSTVLSQNEEQPFDAYLGFAACSILAYLRPYYYDRGQSLMNIASNSRNFLSSLLMLFDDFSLCFPTTKHCGDSCDLNYRSGVYIKEENVGVLLELLSTEELSAILGLEEPSGLLSALRYADKHGTGLLEAFDIHVPISGDFHTSQFNLRAEYLNNLGDETSERDCSNTGFTIGIPVPSSSTISFDDIGSIIYEWMDNECLLPMHRNAPETRRAVSGTINMSMICQDLTPIILIGTEKNVFLHNADSYFEQLRGSLSEYLTQNGLEANFFISAHDENEVPEEICSVKNADVLYKMKPSFILGNHKCSFLFDDQDVEMNFSLKGKLEITVNGKKIDQYKISFSKAHRTVYFVDGSWYTIRVKSTKPTAGELDIQLYKGLFLQAQFKFLQGSEVYSKLNNGILMLGELFTIFFGVLVFMSPRPFVILPLLLLLAVMYKYNKRHHFVLKPVEVLDDTPVSE
ncbi:hypothetical protein F0267_19990 [Vibrio coralliilyticus]|uniref:hypothetical protein n=1 Tax=Vibrio coralliilyticus TaxID=190893 RepID=UPI0003913085|nr:hypothetical protein [Vibrio coralliilyticus]ERB67137.1 hypothetical protein N779_01380 [Vibrio coralliilyticus OCN008]NOH40502.1 hypothetical protein [Vibrio coralliilyticus]QIJ85932.1 hypothetical protein G3U99_16725 [Vibrio coralliilyticus OCN008]